MKPFWRSKTLWVNAGIVGAATWFDQSDFFVNPLWFVYLIASVNMVLRLVTAQGVSWRK